jgi:hypothetical protein
MSTSAGRFAWQAGALLPRAQFCVLGMLQFVCKAGPYCGRRHSTRRAAAAGWMRAWGRRARATTSTGAGPAE